MRCVPIHQLESHEFLLYKQNLIGNQLVSAEELVLFFRQKPNRRILNLPITPYLYAYYKGKKKWLKHLSKDSLLYQETEQYFDSLTQKLQTELDSIIENSSKEVDDYEKLFAEYPKAARLYRKKQKLIKKKNDKLLKLQTKIQEGNWLMRVVGEKPAILDTSLSYSTAQQIQKYLEYKKGLFGSSVVIVWDTLDKLPLNKLKNERLKINLNVGAKLIGQTFVIHETSPTYIRKIIWNIEDSAALRLVEQQTQHPLQNKKIYSEQLLEAERDYLTQLFRNHGYFNFYKNQIRFRVDTVSNYHPDSLDVIGIINFPNNSAKVYVIDTVLMDTDTDVTSQRSIKKVKNFNGITFLLHRELFSARVLDSKIFIRPKEKFSQYYTEETQRALASTEMFKFVNIKFDTTGNQFRANIFTSPFKKYSLTTEVGLNVTQTLPGPFVGVSFKNRNLLRSCDILDVSVRYSVEAQAAATDIGTNLLTRASGVTGVWTFPWIMLPLGGQLKKSLSLKIPQTIISSGYNMVQRPEYARSNLIGAINYKWRNNKNGFWTFGLLDIALVQTSYISPSFRERLSELSRLGNPLERSFNNAIITNTNLGYSFSRNTSLLSNERQSFAKIYLEAGGSYLNFLNIAELNTQGKILGLQTYRYYKVNAEYRKLFNTGKKARVAMRAHFGYAMPYGEKGAVLPYEKLFFAGGSNSIRAWTARRVGPGSFSPPRRSDGTYDYRFEQGADILAEYSIEWRHPIFSFFEGAPFADIGNIWSVKKDEARPGADFEINRFWKELAIGIGYGIRMNFNILIVRFDFALKAYEPARPLSERFVLSKINKKNLLGQPEQMIINVGIGYPF
ncbi:MAG: outer membrane protein assembly factor [Cytophagales bacterium]|nr:outer membrane protein assembly factor [Cytophagales bacterium]MDW8384422.1 BamA/TamA family outer membrane protein [Flammeovirgaceae bacterium]